MKTYKEPKLYIATCTPTFRTEPPAKTPVCLYGVMCKLNVIPGYLKLPKGKKKKNVYPQDTALEDTQSRVFTHIPVSGNRFLNQFFILLFGDFCQAFSFVFSVMRHLMMPML